MDNQADVEYYKKVYLPHLDFTVYFMDMTQLHGTEVKGPGFTCEFGDSGRMASVFLTDIENMVKDIKNTPIIAHELVHVLQIICDNYKMQFENEIEHFAYIMHLLLKELLNTNNAN